MRRSLKGRPSPAHNPWMTKLLPGLPIEWGSEKDGKNGMGEEGWYLRLRHRTGTLCYIPRPSPYVVKTVMIAYLPIMREAHEYRNGIMQRYLFHSLHHHVSKDEEIPAQTKGQTLRLMQQVDLYSHETVMADVPGTTATSNVAPTPEVPTSKKTHRSQRQAVQTRK